MFETINTVFCERVEKNVGRLEFDMTKVYVAERRIPEIAFITMPKAPELLALFNEAYLVLGNYYARLELELDRAHNASARRRAIIILDEVPSLVKDKGFSSARSPMGSEDIREAFVAKDSEFSEIQDRIASFKATKELMYMKLKALDMAFTSVKKIISDRPIIGGLQSAAPIPQDAQVGQNVLVATDNPPAKRGWGKPIIP